LEIRQPKIYLAAKPLYLVIGVRAYSCKKYVVVIKSLFEGYTVTSIPSSKETKKPASPGPTPQQNQGDSNKQDNEKQGGQQQQK